MSGSRRSLILLVALVASIVGASGCHDEGDIEVRSLRFEGNRAFSASQLRAVVGTRTSGFLPWSRRRYFSRSVFEQDLERLRRFYTDRGFPSMQIVSTDVDLNDTNTSVRLRITIDEGTPIRVERVDITGIDGMPPRITRGVEDLPLKAGMVRDQQLVAAARERLASVLRDRGFAHAQTTSEEAPGSQPNLVVITLAATPGPETHFGEITVQGAKSVSDRFVRRSLTFRPGDLFRESRVLESQQRLGSLGLFDFAHVTTNLNANGGDTGAQPTVIPVNVRVTEAPPQRFQFGIGYGTEDGPRGSLNWEHQNFLGEGRRFAFDTRYSLRLQGAGVEFNQPYFFYDRLAFTARAGAWWTKEPTYDSRSLGGRLGVTFRRATRVRRRIVEHLIRAYYINESLNYAITPEALADQTQFDQLIALGLDPTTGAGQGVMAGLGFDFERNHTDQPSNPRAGYSSSVRFVYVAPGFGGTFRYNEVLTELRGYVPIGRRHNWASRARLGAIFSEAADDLPFSQRYFLGGSSNLRGWGRFQVAPLTPDGLPIGGRAVIDLSTELRIWPWRTIGAVWFVDAGNVWDESTTVRVRDLRVAVGPGLRWLSPVGIVRGDLGIQLTPIDGLVIEGEPEKRQWRVHFSIGHAF